MHSRRSLSVKTSIGFRYLIIKWIRYLFHITLINDIFIKSVTVVFAELILIILFASLEVNCYRFFIPIFARVTASIKYSNSEIISICNIQ